MINLLLFGLYGCLGVIIGYFAGRMSTIKYPVKLKEKIKVKKQ